MKASMKGTKDMQLERLETPNSELAFYGEPGRRGAGKTLVLGHALGADRDMWRRVLPLLPQDLNVILWELPGHGNSGLLDVDIEEATRGGVGAPAVAESLHRGLGDLGVEDQPFILGGLSLGGTVALAYAEAYPELLESLVVFGSGPALLPPTTWTDRVNLVLTRGLEPLADPTMERWFSASFRQGDGKQAVQETRDTLAQTSPEGYAECCLVIAGTDLRPDLGLITVPAYVVVGENDGGMGPEAGKELVEALPNAQLKVIEGAAHLMAVEAPEQVAAVISEALTDR